MAYRYLIAIDDTDDIGTRGTGDIATDIANALLARCGGEASWVSRHQLYVHPDIPYTSHNSAMCFVYEGEAAASAIEAIAVAVLHAESAPAADPGLAFVCLDDFAAQAELVDFGHSAKTMVLTKAQAYALADTLGVHLSEHGGTGQGVIGALAGLGLWLDGNDGRLKGHFDVGQGVSVQAGSEHAGSAKAGAGKGEHAGEGIELSVRALLAKTRVDAVIDLDDQPLPDDARVLIQGKLKAVRRHGRSAILVSRVDGAWRNARKQQLKDY